jgi:hypothetical protein
MTRHVVVDGSNLATEGRSMPSLTQLNEAVLAFMAEHPEHLVTVVVDATFGHRIDAAEAAEFDAAVANNELVAPPAGAVGRGDAFVLSIANKVGAVVLSNDSFQEFHAQYEWLFEEGRLIGGKPVPHVGWVFVARVPVRGPVSRRATREAKRTGDRSKVDRRPSKAASEPLPVPKMPPPGPAKRAVTPEDRATPEDAAPPAPKRGEPVNDLLAFLEFVEHHPVGSPARGVVETYSSHGAYLRIGDVLGYVPLRYMGDPAPRSARSVMKIGDEVALVVREFHAQRRSIDLAVPALGSTEDAIEEKPVKKAPSKRGSAKKAQVAKVAAEKAPAKKTPAKKVSAEKVPAEKVPAKKTPAKKVSAEKVPAEKAPVKKVAAEKVPAKRNTAKKVAAENAPVKKVAAEKVPAKRNTAKKVAAEKVPSKRNPVKKTPAEKVPAKKAPTKKTAKMTTTRRTVSE